MGRPVNPGAASVAPVRRPPMEQIARDVDVIKRGVIFLVVVQVLTLAAAFAAAFLT